MDKSIKERIKFANDELFENGNFTVINELFAVDYTVHAGGKEYKGHEFIKRWVRQLRSAIPDIRVVKVEFYVQTGDIIVWQRTLRGTHESDMMGIPATGRKAEWREMAVSRFRGEKIAEEWVVSELAGELLSKSPIA